MATNNKREIVVTIDQDGNPSIEAFGFTNGACRKETAEIEEALGTVTKRKVKDPHCDDVKVKVPVK